MVLPLLLPGPPVVPLLVPVPLPLLARDQGYEILRRCRQQRPFHQDPDHQADEDPLPVQQDHHQ